MAPSWQASLCGAQPVGGMDAVAGERWPEAIEAMTPLNAQAARAAGEAGAECATEITGFGLLGHLQAGGVAAMIDATAVR